MTQQATEMSAGVTQVISKRWSDGLAAATPLLDMVVKGDAKEKETGGTLLQWMVKLIKNQAQGFLGGNGGIVSVVPSIQNQYAYLNWKYFYWGTNFTLGDYTIANGEEDKVKILAKKIKGSIADANRAMAYATYNGSSSDALAFEGLADAFAASGTSYGGLTDTDYTDDTSAYLPYISTATQPTYATISDMINKVKKRVQQSEYNPSRYFGLMNSGVFSKFQQAVQSAQMFIDSKDMYSVGFQAFRVNGVEFYLDAYVQGSDTAASADNYCYIIPMDVFKFHYKFGFDSASPFDVKDLRIPDQPILTTQNFVAGNWIYENRHVGAVTKTLTI